jgi:hypothetical protein
MTKAVQLFSWFLLMAVVGFAIGMLTGCGGGDGAMPFGPVTQQASETDVQPSTDETRTVTTLPVVCQPSGCAK